MGSSRSPRHPWRTPATPGLRISPRLILLPCRPSLPGRFALCLRGLVAIRVALRLRTWRPLCCGARVMTTGSLGVGAEGACCACKALFFCLR